MSTDEDVELKDLVAQTLEINGCLPKIRAELRASVFLALEKDGEKEKALLNKKVTEQLETREGRVMFCLVREFLEYFNLDFTVSVYEPESYLGTSYNYEGRTKIVQELGIKQLKEESRSPLLLQLIQIAQSKSSIEIDLSKIQNGVGAGDSSVDTTSSEELLDKSEKVDESEDKETSLVDPIVSLAVEMSQASKEDVSDSVSSISMDLDKTPSHLDKSPDDFSPPVLKDSKSDKFKTSPKGDKLKSKSSLSSLADLPPLPLNKPRSNEALLLPSLYNKDFKESKGLNQNLREIDRFFDMELDNYEEDFMSDSDVNINKSSESSKSNQSQEFDPNKTYDVSKLDK